MYALKWSPEAPVNTVNLEKWFITRLFLAPQKLVNDLGHDNPLTDAVCVALGPGSFPTLSNAAGSRNGQLFP